MFIVKKYDVSGQAMFKSGKDVPSQRVSFNIYCYSRYPLVSGAYSANFHHLTKVDDVSYQNICIVRLDRLYDEVQQ